MNQQILSLYATLFARPRFFKLNRYLMQLGMRGLGVLNYSSDWLSGELSLLSTILREIDVAGANVIDVGANVGNFSQAVLAGSQRLGVVAFEPHPRTFAQLQDNLAHWRDSPRLTLHNLAVGTEAGTLELFDYEGEGSSVHASVYAEVISQMHRQAPVAHQVKVVSLDAVDLAGSIALIKIDVEGHELAVLQGARQTLASHRPRYIMLEFNEMNTKSRTFLKDVVDAVPGYEPFRILPGGRLLPLCAPYQPWTHEIFAYQNLLLRAGGP